MGGARYGRRDSHEIVRCIESNYLIDYSHAFSRGAKGAHASDAPVIWSYSGIAGNAFNWITQAAIEGDEREQIARTIARYRDWKTSFWWMTGPGTRPTDLSKYLLEAGFMHLFAGPGMALDLDALPSTWEIPAGVTIRRLSLAQVLADWSPIDISAMSDENRTAVHSAFSGVPSTYAPEWFVAYRGDVPVCRCLIFVGSDRDVVSIHDLYTIPSETRQGIGTSVSWHALNEARARGCNLAVLVASESGERIYRKMGFERFAEIEFFAREYDGC